MLRYFEPHPDPFVHAPEIADGTRLLLFDIANFPNDLYYEPNPKYITGPTPQDEWEWYAQLRHWLRDRAGLSDERIARLLS